MTLYLAVPLLVLAAIVQASAVPRLAVWGVYPDLPLVLVACWGYLRGWREGLVWGLIAGLALDLLSGAPLGAATAAMAAAGFLAGRARISAPRNGLLVPLVGLFLLTILYDLVFMLALAVSGRAVLWPETLARIVLPSAVLNGVLAVGVYWLMRVLHARFGSEEIAW